MLLIHSYEYEELQEFHSAMEEAKADIVCLWITTLKSFSDKLQEKKVQKQTGEVQETPSLVQVAKKS
jgi:hypothetical protein